MTKPKSRCRVDHENEKQKVDLSNEVVGEKDSDFDCRDYQKPNLHLIASFVSPVVSLDIALYANHEADSLYRDKDIEDIVHNFGTYGQFSVLAS